MPGVVATVIVQGGGNKGLNKGDCCGAGEDGRRHCRGRLTRALVIGWLWKKREREEIKVDS